MLNKRSQGVVRKSKKYGVMSQKVVRVQLAKVLVDEDMAVSQVQICFWTLNVSLNMFV